MCVPSLLPFPPALIFFSLKKFLHSHLKIVIACVEDNSYSFATTNISTFYRFLLQLKLLNNRPHNNKRTESIEQGECEREWQERKEREKTHNNEIGILFRTGETLNEMNKYNNNNNKKNVTCKTTTKIDEKKKTHQNWRGENRK